MRRAAWTVCWSLLLTMTVQARRVLEADEQQAQLLVRELG